MKTENNKGLGGDSRMYLLFGVWYLAGSTVSTFLSGTLVAKLQPELDPARLGSLAAIAGLPWVVKPLWGVLIDRFKTMYWWAMAVSVAIAFSVLGLTAEKVPYWLIVAIVLLPHTLRSLQDVAVDGLSIAVSRKDQRGTIQSWMRVGTIAGSLVGGAGAMYFSKIVPWTAVCVALMVTAVIFGVVMPWFLGHNMVRKDRGGEKVSWGDFAKMCKSPPVLLALLLAVVAVPAQQITYTVFFGWWSSDHYSKGMVAEIFLWAPLFQLFGAWIGGVLVKRTGKAHAVVVAAIVVAAAYVLIGVKADWSEWFVMSLSWLTGIADTIYAVALFALLMDLADRRFTAMSFALFMAGTNLCGVWGNWLGGQLSDDGMSVARVFVLAGVAQLVVLPIVFAIERKRKRKA